VAGEVDSVLGEAEPSELPAVRTANRRWSWAGLSVVRAHPRLSAAVALIGLAAASILLRVFIVGQISGVWIRLDELAYEEMARSFAHSGHVSILGKSGLAYSPLYSIVLSPIYALTSSMQTAYEWAKVENAVLISLSVFPIYAIARSVLSRGRSVAVAAVSLVAPLMLYSGFEMSESLAYPLCLVAIWAMLRAVRRPTVANDALLLLTIALASAARLQLVVLLPAALTAVVVVAMLRPPPRERGRSRAVLRAVLEHWLLFGIVGAAFLAVLVSRAVNGGALPFAGRYSNVGTAHASPLRVFELFFQHLGGLDWAVGVIPFACALLGCYVLVRAGFPRRALIFASVAAASVFWFLLEVAFDAAAFDSTRARGGPVLSDPPRIHERYLIYLLPFFLVALVGALPAFRNGKIATRRHLVIAAVVTLLPALIPFGTVINNTSVSDSFSLQPFGAAVHGFIESAPHATTAAVGLSAILAFAYFRAAVRPLPSLVITVTVLVFLGLSFLEFSRQSTPFARASVGLPSYNNWVDRATGGRGTVDFVSGDRPSQITILDTAFWNTSVDRVYYTCSMSLGSSFGEEPISGPIQTPYAVVPADFHVHGRVVARDRPGRLVLIAPPGGTLTVPRADLQRCTR
jgi:hypothetical protein